MDTAGNLVSNFCLVSLLYIREIDPDTINTLHSHTLSNFDRIIFLFYSLHVQHQGIKKIKI